MRNASFSRQCPYALIFSIDRFPNGPPAARRRRNCKCSVNGVVWRVRLPTFAVGVTVRFPPRQRKRLRLLPSLLHRALLKPNLRSRKSLLSRRAGRRSAPRVVRRWRILLPGRLFRARDWAPSRRIPLLPGPLPRTPRMNRRQHLRLLRLGPSSAFGVRVAPLLPEPRFPAQVPAPRSGCDVLPGLRRRP